MESGDGFAFRALLERVRRRALDRLKLQEELDAIGRMRADDEM